MSPEGHASFAEILSTSNNVLKTLVACIDVYGDAALQDNRALADDARERAKVALDAAFDNIDVAVTAVKKYGPIQS